MRENLENLYNPKLFYDPKSPPLGCMIQAYGVNFEPDAFLNESNFTIEEILAKGIIGFPDAIKKKIDEDKLSYPNALDIFDMPILLISVSKAIEPLTQIEEAIQFFKSHLHDLMKLSEYPDVENILMQFFVEKYECLSDSQNLPNEFYDLYSQCGIKGLIFGSANHT